MNKKAILWIVIAASASLLGIVFTQLYWVDKSMELKEDQFDNSVRLAVKSVMNRMLEHKNDSATQQYLYELSCRKPRLEVTDVIHPAILDSLLHEELHLMKLDENYAYGMYSARSEEFVAGNYAGYEEKLLTTPFHFSLSSLYRPGDYYLSLYFPSKTSILLRQMEFWLLLSVFFLIVVVISFVFVISLIFRQKRLSEMKNDFINNMTHEFKTPIATSSLAAEMILKSEMITNTERVKKYARVILDENYRLQNQVELVLQMATLENGKQRFKMKKTSMHTIIESVVDSLELRLKENDIDLALNLSAGDDLLVGDRVHLQNVILNLLDNAIKYSPEKPTISIETWNGNGGIHVVVKDNGIGIDPLFQKSIFKNLFRVPTGNIHEVRGFGLGLYYAKTVVDLHHGKISLESEPGKGSAFDVFLPFERMDRA